MPHASGLLTAFARRDTIDKVMFGWVRGVTRVLPGVGVKQAITIFAKEYGLGPAEFNVDSYEKRYARMLKDFYEDQKTHDETTGKE